MSYRGNGGNNLPGDDSGLEYVDRLLETPPGTERDALLAHLSGSLRAEIEPLLAAGDLAWESQFVAPPIEQDPLAAMLGLVPNPSYRVNAASLAKARKARSMTVGDLAGQLTRRGWETRARDVFAWEKRSTSLPPAVVRAIASLLKTAPKLLTMSTESPEGISVSTPSPNLGPEGTAAAARSHPRFQALVARYAALTGTTPREATDAMSVRMLSTVHRGNHPDQEQMLSSLEGLLDALEQRGKRPNDAGPGVSSKDSQ